MSENFKIDCGACGATGLYKGFAEPPGTAVICNNCRGKGYREATAVMEGVKLFTQRKPKPGITRVMGDGGMWMTRQGNEKTISIEEFNALMDKQ